MLTSPTPAWFEIPTADLARACSFYESLFGKELKLQTMGPMKMAIFPNEGAQQTGALVECEGYEPATTGSVVYLEVDDVRSTLERLQASGGESLFPATALPDNGGFFAQLRDSEGNRVGIYSKTSAAA